MEQPLAYPLPCDPFWLNFYDTRLEAEYRRWRNEKELYPLDSAVWYIYLVVNLLFNFGLVVTYPNDPGGYITVALPASLYFFSIAFHGYMLHLGPVQFGRIRTVTVAIFRCVYLAFAASGFFGWFIRTPVESVGSFLKVIIVGPGLIMFNWLGLGMPLFFREQLPVQLLCVAGYIWALNHSVCGVLAETSVGQRMVLRIWHALSVASGQVVGALQPFATPIPWWESTTKDDFEIACLTLVTFLQMSVGFLFPSTVVYCFEHSSRVRFLTHHASNSTYRRAGHLPPDPWLPLVNGAGVPGSWVLVLWMSLVLLLLVLVTTWELSMTAVELGWRAIPQAATPGIS